MRRWIAMLPAVLLVLSAGMPLAQEQKAEKRSDAERRREKIDQRAKWALEELFKKSEKAKELFESAHGYAVFDNTKVTLGLTGGGGTGVAVHKGSGKRTYMKMATGGVALGIGAQSYQVIFFFQDASTFDNFVEKGWEAEAGADASAGTAGANVQTGFRNGMATWVLTKAGLMASADLSGTKYWKNEKLNR